ncbi:MAG: hypothetical protein AB9834_20540 [Lentimicrobium sp.]
MNRKQQLIWTVLPNGIINNQYQFSVFITPRLSISNGSIPVDELGNYKQFYYKENSKNKCWTDRLKSLKFSLLVNNKAIEVSINQQLPDAEFWNTLFERNTPVKPYAFDDLSKRAIRSFPVKSILEYLTGKYSEIAKLSPDKLPQLQSERNVAGGPVNGKASLESLADDLADSAYCKDLILDYVKDDGDKKVSASIVNQDNTFNINFIEKVFDIAGKSFDKSSISRYDDHTLKTRSSDTNNPEEYYIEENGNLVQVYKYIKSYSIIDAELEKNKVIEPGKDYGLDKQKFNMLQAYRFFNRVEADSLNLLTPELPEFDFHEMHSVLGDYQVLMRKLGFILDFTVACEKIRPAATGNNRYPVSLQLQAPTGTPDNIVEYTFPSTLCDFYSADGLSVSSLFAAPRNPGRISNGYLNLNNGPFDIVQIDPDGAMLKLTHAAQSMKRQMARKYICTINSGVLDKCHIGYLHISRIIKKYNDDIEIARKDLQDQRDAAKKAGETVKEVRCTEELTKLTKIYIYPESKINRLKPNMWEVTTNHIIYQIEQVKPGIFHFYSVNKVAIDTTTDSGLPAIQSAGIGLIQSDRAWDIHKDLGITSQNNSNPANSSFYAEDLLRGYRIDVMSPAENIWRPVCRRQGNYAIKKDNILRSLDGLNPFIDEGYVKGTSASSAAAGGDLYVHELLFAWDGWSLVAERPGKTIISNTHENGVLSEDVGLVEPKVHEKFGLVTKFRPVSGELPRLRFGYNYRIRVRTVDLAGNGLPHNDDNTEFTLPITYRRFEPVVSPTLYPLQLFRHGETAERMVIRSFNEVDNLAISGENDVRHVVPPKTSQLMAETHGMFDKLIKDGALDKAFELAVRSSGLLNLNDPLAAANQIESSGGNNTEGTYIIIKAEQITLPYLPDVLAKGVILRNVPGAKDFMGTGIEYISAVDGLKIPFYKNRVWPSALPFRIAIMEGAEGTGPKWDSTSRILTIILPKALQCKILYSCYFNKEDLILMGIWNWMVRPDNKLRKIAVSGCHWMMTPFRELSLVHAVQKPLQVPAIDKITGTKTLYQTFAEIGAIFNIHPKSTGKITLMAYWSDPVDYPDQPEPSREDKNAIAFEMGIDENENNLKILPVTPCSSHKHEFGNTHFHRVSYHLNATSRFTDCFDSSGGALNFSTEGPVVSEVKILNSARPESPKVKYIIPTFLWDFKSEKIRESGMFNPIGQKLTRTRIGGGLRVYMDRPWFSSGDDELLAVVLPHNISHELLKPYITQWGQDPVHISLKTKNLLTANDFAGKTETGNELGLTIDEVAWHNGLVDVAAYKPEFDKNKRLWYCDVKLKSSEIKSYFPFIQLKLARYQPYSVKDAHLSRVVKTDFIQLPNDRKLIVELTKNAFTKIEVRGYGPGINNPRDDKRNRVEISIEKKKNNLEWIETGSKTELALQQDANNYNCVWTLLQPEAAFANRMVRPGTYRIVVKEFEKYGVDPHRSAEVSGERMVYSDLVEFRVTERTGVIELL